VDAPVKLVGSPGSPYSRKMRAVLRYRRIPHRWILRRSKDDRDLPPVPVDLIPVLVFRPLDGSPEQAMIDSTFQIRRLETLHGGRHVLPPDPPMAFLDFLLEDFADEWLTKAMFHYRWSFEADVKNAAAILPRWSRIDAPEESVARMANAFAERQVGRRALVGINDVTAPLIEEGYRRVLRGLDALLTQQPFVAGHRPGSADFAFFGQLSQLALFDPTSVAVAREEAPRVMAWCEVVEDLSGLEVHEEDWMHRDALPDGLRQLLALAGETYAPFLLANADALERGADRLDCTISGRRFVQRPFAYQRKCLGWLRDAYAGLYHGDRAIVDAELAGTGCEVLFRDLG
jgi:glutathione S-transferase